MSTTWDHPIATAATALELDPAERRRQINRQNAAKSTGPRSEEGKTRSRRNALKHGLRAETVVLDDELPLFEAALERWSAKYPYDDVDDLAILRRTVLAQLRLERCEAAEAVGLQRCRDEAAAAFDREQAEAAAQAVALLAKRPADALDALHATAAGLRALASRWRHLAKLPAQPPESTALIGHCHTAGFKPANLGTLHGAYADLLRDAVAAATAQDAARWSSAQEALSAACRQFAEAYAQQAEAAEPAEAAARRRRIAAVAHDTSPQGQLRFRYEQAAERMLLRGIRELRTLQAKRANGSTQVLTSVIGEPSEPAVATAETTEPAPNEANLPEPDATAAVEEPPAPNEANAENATAAVEEPPAPNEANAENATAAVEEPPAPNEANVGEVASGRDEPSPPNAAHRVEREGRVEPTGAASDGSAASGRSERAA